MKGSTVCLFVISRRQPPVSLTPWQPSHPQSLWITACLSSMPCSAALLHRIEVTSKNRLDLIKWLCVASYIVCFCCQFFFQIINGTDILEVLHDFPELKQYVHSLYYCQYDEFFKSLSKSYLLQWRILNEVFLSLSLSPTVWVEKDFKCDRYLASHARYFIREMRIKAYTQLLESYRSLSLSHMAHSFGVSVEFMDKELSRFIASGRLHCRIDKVGGVVETNRPDSKNFLYQVRILQGQFCLVMVVNVACFDLSDYYQAGRSALE